MSIAGRAKAFFMTGSRSRKISHFYEHFKDGMTVLDAGVSWGTNSDTATENFFLKHFRYDPKYYTGLGVQDLTGLRERHPGKTFITYPGGRFPFADQQFDWVFSNAVIEHVGDEQAQLMFLNEMLRVGKNVFFTTPNKFFPIETHTSLPLIHWYDPLFYWFCRKTNRYVRRENLNLLSFGRLRKIVNASQAKRTGFRKNRLFGWPMTFTVVCSK